MAETKRARRYLEKSAVMNFRITPGTKQLLRQAARASGRTLSAECEAQLQRALSDIGTGPTYALMATIGRTIDGLVRMRVNGDQRKEEKNARWWDDPYLFDQAAQVISAAIEMFRPQAEPVDIGSDQEELDYLRRRQGKFALETTLRDIQLADPSIPFAKQTPYWRWLNLLKRDLGPLADRPVIWGEGADEARERNALAEPILRELIPLSRKNAKTPTDMTPQEAKRLQELWSKLAEIGGGKKS